MPSLVCITQTQEEETMLLKQITDMKLNSTGKFPNFMPTTTQTPLHVLHKTTPPTPTSMFMPIDSSSLTTGLALSSPKYVPDIIGSTLKTIPAVTLPTVNQWDCYRAQHYYKFMKRKDPKYLLVMANGTINPMSGFPFAYDEDPFISYHKKNEFKVGNIHLRCEVVRRARLDPNFTGSKKDNSDPPKTASWSRTKCEDWLRNNPINNDEDYQYIVDTVQKLFKSVAISNQERRTSGNEPWKELQLQSDNESLNDLQNQPCTPVPLSIPSLTNTPVVLKPAFTSLFRQPERATDANRSRNKVTSSSKRTGLMDPATFKLVLEHQKEYSVQDKTIRSHDPITIARKKQWNTFWTSTTKIARKKKKNVKYVWEKKEAAVQKARVDFLDQIHDLNTPMSY